MSHKVFTSDCEEGYSSSSYFQWFPVLGSFPHIPVMVIALPSAPWASLPNPVYFSVQCSSLVICDLVGLLAVSITLSLPRFSLPVPGPQNVFWAVQLQGTRIYFLFFKDYCSFIISNVWKLWFEMFYLCFWLIITEQYIWPLCHVTARNESCAVESYDFFCLSDTWCGTIGISGIKIWRKTRCLPCRFWSLLNGWILGWSVWL